jgi:RNA polymerase sigma-70 factor (ECF subfamily)
MTQNDRSETPVIEETLLQQIYQGEPDAFDQLYTRHAQTIYRLGWSMLRETQAAEDVVQETFMRAYRARKRFDPAKASFGTWLYQIALNYCRSYLRRKQLPTLPWFSHSYEGVAQPTLAPGPEGRLLRDEYQRALWEAVESLSSRLKEVIILHYYLDLPAVEIAVILNCPEGTIYSRLHNARKQLAKLLAHKGFASAELSEVHHVS